VNVRLRTHHQNRSPNQKTFYHSHIESCLPNGQSPPWLDRESTPVGRARINPNICNPRATKNESPQRQHFTNCQCPMRPTKEQKTCWKPNARRGPHSFGECGPVVLSVLRTEEKIAGKGNCAIETGRREAINLHGKTKQPN